MLYYLLFPFIYTHLNRNSFVKVVKKRDRNFTQHQIQIRRKEGYAAAEKRAMSRTVELCCIESNDIVGKSATVGQVITLTLSTF